MVAQLVYPSGKEVNGNSFNLKLFYMVSDLWLSFSLLLNALNASFFLGIEGSIFLFKCYLILIQNEMIFPLNSESASVNSYQTLLLPGQFSNYLYD